MTAALGGYLILDVPGDIGALDAGLFEPEKGGVGGFLLAMALMLSSEIR